MMKARFILSIVFALSIQIPSLRDTIKGSIPEFRRSWLGQDCFGDEKCRPLEELISEEDLNQMIENCMKSSKNCLDIREK